MQTVSLFLLLVSVIFLLFRFLCNFFCCWALLFLFWFFFHRRLRFGLLFWLLAIIWFLFLNFFRFLRFLLLHLFGLCWLLRLPHFLYLFRVRSERRVLRPLRGDRSCLLNQLVQLFGPLRARVRRDLVALLENLDFCLLELSGRAEHWGRRDEFLILRFQVSSCQLQIRIFYLLGLFLRCLCFWFFVFACFCRLFTSIERLLLLLCIKGFVQRLVLPLCLLQCCLRVQVLRLYLYQLLPKL